ncbi:MAG: hypothetical protein QM756_40700 [Polyangiaceae bacterium]
MVLLAERLDPQQDQAGDLRVGYFGVVEGLVGVVDRFAVDTEPVLSVVLDLDGEVAAHGFDEHLVQDVHVRVRAGDLVLACGGRPLEGVRDAAARSLPRRAHR